MALLLCHLSSGLIIFILLLFLRTGSPTAIDAVSNTNASTTDPKNGNDLRQNTFLEWLATILRPNGTSTTAPQSMCPACTCGSINTVRRIVGGQETVVRAYPWMALLSAYGDFYCGGTLINNLYVVTAAHCLRGIAATGIKVRLLEHDRRNASVYVVDRTASALIIHERYNPRTYDSDLGLIRLSKPVEFNERLRPVCMPPADNDFAGELGLVTGWGTLSQGGAVSNTLQEVEVPILSQNECYNSEYESSRITDNMICAGFKEGSKDSCQGDSGGPLHVRLPDTKEHQLAGVVSWGEGCAQPNRPGVYTRVNQFSDWITKHTLDGCNCPSAGMTESTTQSITVATESTTQSITVATESSSEVTPETTSVTAPETTSEGF